MDEATGILINHDGYRADEKGGDTPEALAGLFLLGYDVDQDTLNRTMEYFLKPMYQYAGQPMLSSMLGVAAARVGDRDAALELFERGYADFLVDPFRITAEFSPKVFPQRPVAGPFTANLAGFLQACLFGLGGLRIGGEPPESWAFRPVTMPSGWDGISVERLWAHGRPYSLTGEHGAPHAHFTCDQPPDE
jgi:hypothetical protein